MSKSKTDASHTITGTWRTALWVMIGLISGLVVGAASALLYAPKSGKKMRRQVTKNVQEGLSSGQDAVDPVVKRLEKEMSELRETVEDRIAKLR